MVGAGDEMDAHARKAAAKLRELRRRWRKQLEEEEG
jgi:hypothetical protein